MCDQIQQKENVLNKKKKMKRIKKSRKKIGQRELPEEILKIISEFAKPIGFITQCQSWDSQGRIDMEIFLDSYKRKMEYMSLLPPVQRKLIKYIINEKKMEIILPKERSLIIPHRKGVWRGGARGRIPKKKKRERELPPGRWGMGGLYLRRNLVFNHSYLCSDCMVFDY